MAERKVDHSEAYDISVGDIWVADALYGEKEDERRMNLEQLSVLSQLAIAERLEFIAYLMDYIWGKD